MKRRLAVLFLALVSGCASEPLPPSDGGSDASDARVQPDAWRACEASADCDDGVFCNGEEICEEGACVRAPRDCDDGIACTIDSCSEDLRLCVSVAPDADGDGARDASCLDEGSVPLGTDCDDDDATAFPGNREVCDVGGHDEDCDPTTLGGLDVDGDGFVSSECCNGATCGDDCDDARSTTHPGSVEVCDGFDQDCANGIDDGVALDGFEDRDRDGWGDSSRPLAACASTVGWAALGGDCNDDPASPDAIAQNPGQPEICDGIRNDCASEAADVGASAVPWYRDLDGDGFGSAASGVTVSCTPVTGSSLLASDCDDTNPMRHPAAPELCNAIDDDCSGSANFLIGPNDTEDDDRDGLADLRCGPLGVDCDDHDPASAPGEAERCDGRDNDCDGNVDEGAMSVVLYRDLDGDGFGAIASGATIGCMAMSGFVTRGGDCNDADAARFPGATESCDAADQDCDSTIDEAPASSMCAPPFTSASACVAGRCTVDACNAGRGDCNHLPLDGCEVNLTNDANSCGACGRACATGVPCVAGRCQASQLFPLATAASLQPRSVTYTIDTPAPATIRYTTDGSVPGSPTTISAPSPVYVTLADAQRLRWYADYGGGIVEALQEVTHYTDTVVASGVEGSSTHPRDNWALLIENLDLNGQGPAITVAPGATVTATSTATYWRAGSAGYCPGCITYVGLNRLTALDGSTAVVTCASSSVLYPGTTAPMPFTFTAPTVPGRYPIYARVNWDVDCRAGGGGEVGYVIVAAP